MSFWQLVTLRSFLDFYENVSLSILYYNLRGGLLFFWLFSFLSCSCSIVQHVVSLGSTSKDYSKYSSWKVSPCASFASSLTRSWTWATTSESWWCQHKPLFAYLIQPICGFFHHSIFSLLIIPEVWIKFMTFQMVDIIVMIQLVCSKIIHDSFLETIINKNIKVALFQK